MKDFLSLIPDRVGCLIVWGIFTITGLIIVFIVAAIGLVGVICAKTLVMDSPILIERALTILRDPLWQGIGGIVGVLALIIAIASELKRRE